MEAIKEVGRRNKKWIFVLGCGFVFFAIALILLLNSGSQLSMPEAQRLVDNAVDMTMETMEESNLLKDILSEKLSIVVLDLERDHDCYQCVCEVTSVDCADVLIEYLSQISSDEVASGNEVIERLKHVVSASPVVKKTFTITFEKVEDGYTPVFTEEMVNFCSGNMYPVQQYLIERLGKEAEQ